MKPEPPQALDIRGSPQAPPRFPLSTLADFTRDSGGLLRVLHGVLLLGQAYVVGPRAVCGQWWSPFAFMPLYLGYFLVRGRLWRWLYGKAGLVEREKSLKNARLMAWGVPVVLVPTIALTWPTRVHPAPLAASVWVALAWSLGMWGVVIIAGRLQVDWLYFFGSHVYLLDVSLRAVPSYPASMKYPHGELRLFVVFLIAGGLYEHWRFQQAHLHAAKEGA